MQTITDLNCRLNTTNATWSIDLIFDDRSGVHSFTLDDAASVETFLEIFEDCTACHYDAEKKEVVFAFEYLDSEDEDEEEDDASEEDDDATAEADSTDNEDESSLKKAV